MWEILSYQGTIDEVVLTRYLERLPASPNEAQGSDPGRCDPEKKRAAQIAKDKLRLARWLQKRSDLKTLQVEQCSAQQRELLRELQKGVLREEANRCVLEQGRGRLRGSAPDDFVDIGPNKEFSFVSSVLDGPYQPPCINRFRQ